MTRHNRRRFIALILAVAAGCDSGPAAPQEPPNGAELTYRVIFPANFKGDKAEDTRKIVSVLMKRLDRRGLKEPKIAVQGDDQIVIQLPGVDRAELEDFKKIIRTGGKLEFKPCATKEVHETYNREKRVPSGYEAYNPKDNRGTAYEFIQEHLLVHKDSAITGEDISKAEAEFDLEGLRPGEQPRWKVSFTLTDDGSANFDAAAAKLYSQTPRGMIAIILDGKLFSHPAVQSAKFGGRGQITGGFSESEAKDIAVILKSGSLVRPIGRIDDGVAKPGEPESERFYPDRK